MAQEWLVIYCLVDKAVSLARKYTMIGRSKSLENLRELRIIRLAAITYATYSRKRLRSKSTGLMSSAPVTELLISKDRVSVVMGGKTSKRRQAFVCENRGRRGNLFAQPSSPIAKLLWILVYWNVFLLPIIYKLLSHTGAIMLLFDCDANKILTSARHAQVHAQISLYHALKFMIIIQLISVSQLYSMVYRLHIGLLFTLNKFCPNFHQWTIMIFVEMIRRGCFKVLWQSGARIIF